MTSTGSRDLGNTGGSATSSRSLTPRRPPLYKVPGVVSRDSTHEHMGAISLRRTKTRVKNWKQNMPHSSKPSPHSKGHVPRVSNQKVDGTSTDSSGLTCRGSSRQNARPKTAHTVTYNRMPHVFRQILVYSSLSTSSICEIQRVTSHGHSGQPQSADVDRKGKTVTEEDVFGSLFEKLRGVCPNSAASLFRYDWRHPFRAFVGS